MTSDNSSANDKLKRVLKAGKLFEGKYRIMRPLGAGSFAVVVHATHEVMGRDVALKFLKPKVVEGNPEVSERFVKEVQIASRLQHPNVVAIYDFGHTQDDIYYMVQEFIDGQTVDELMPPGKPMPRARVIDIVLQVLSCLQEAHTQGIIHRDLKPSNLMSTSDEGGQERIKILDFGVAKLLEKDEHAGFGGSAARQSTKFIGTPIYMSPEQILGKGVQPSSDLYSVGLMLYEMLTGQAPIQAEQIAQVVQKHLSSDPFDFPMLHLLSDHLQRTILKATHRDPEKRFENANDFAAALMGTGLGVFDSEAHDQDDPHAKTSVSLDASHLQQGVDEGALHEPSEASRGGLQEDSDLDDIFLGRNYIDGFDESFLPKQADPVPLDALADADISQSTPQEAPYEFEPLSAQSQRLKKQQMALKSSASSARADSGSTPAARALHSADAAPSTPSSVHRRQQAASAGGGEELELDMDAMRQVRATRQHLTAVNSIDKAQPARSREVLGRDDEAPLPMRLGVYAVGALVSYLNFVMLSVITDGFSAPARVIIGLSPLLLAAGWLALEPKRSGSVFERVLKPIVMRIGVLFCAILVLMLLIVPDRAAIAFTHEGTWFFEHLPDIGPFTVLKGVTGAFTSAIAGIAEAMCGIVPWVDGGGTQ